MKKLWFFFVVIFSFVFVTVLTAQNVSPHFSELKGMEDDSRVIHIYYIVFILINMVQVTNRVRMIFII